MKITVGFLKGAAVGFALAIFLVIILSMHKACSMAKRVSGAPTKPTEQTVE
jgi:MFS superfamily sulfate permease-like transporter